MLVVDKFLWYFKLETGVLIIGWFLLISNFIAALIFGKNIVQNVFDCKNVPVDDDGSTCHENKSTVVSAVLAIFACTLIIVGYLSIKGTKERNYKLIKPLMIWQGISIFGSFISIIFEPTSGVIALIVNVYMFVALYSFYKKLKEENGSIQAFDLPELSDLKSKI